MNVIPKKPILLGHSWLSNSIVGVFHQAKTVTLKTQIITAACLVTFWSTVYLVGMSRFYVGVNPSFVSCLKAYVFLVDKSDTEVRHGDIVAFEIQQDLRHLKKGYRLAKLVAGMPGDTVTFTAEALYVNDKRMYGIASMKDMLTIFEHTFEQYQSSYTLSDDEYFMVGETRESFDSRYWGPVKRSQLVGKGYAIY